MTKPACVIGRVCQLHNEEYNDDDVFIFVLYVHYTGLPKCADSSVNFQAFFVSFPFLSSYTRILQASILRTGAQRAHSTSIPTHSEIHGSAARRVAFDPIFFLGVDRIQTIAPGCPPDILLN